MSGKNRDVLGEIKEAAASLKTFEIIFPMISDFLFLLAYGAISGYYMTQIINNLYGLGASMLKAQEALSMTYLRDIGSSLFLLGILLFIAYVALQGISWRYSRAFAHKKEPLMNYLRHFFFVNILWYLLFVMFFIASFAADYLEKRTIYITVILYTLLFVIIYFAFISYALLGKNNPVRTAFRLGVSRASSLAPKIFLGLLTFILADFLLSFLYSLSWGLMILLGVSLLLPLATFLRVYTQIIVRNAV